VFETLDQAAAYKACANSVGCDTAAAATAALLLLM
jgi:hypothetical protein